ncbi:hypothetical protein OIU76_007414 [Salix suchowensis]|nr:hypothetical protein OIU76_007414 [Salix suchowensis]
MLLLSQAPRGALSAKRRTPLKFAHQNPPLFFKSTKPKFNSRKQSTFPLTLAKPEGGLDSHFCNQAIPLDQQSNPLSFNA